MIRVDYLVRVISLLLLIGILTSCVPEEDAVESSSSGGGANLGGSQMLWGSSTSNTVTFSTPFTEPPVVVTSFCETGTHPSGGDNITVTKTGFTTSFCTAFSWQAIGR